ncbi:MAG: hypothetical protein EPN31_07140 [Castellaniella sp.]|nr:MAG: hypothetical protein EPN31_07140 [Castellaniella sp.]
MKNPCLALRLALVAVACASVTAYADSLPEQTSLNHRSQPSPTAQRANDASGSSGRRLTIRSGEGERLNLPWFIRDIQGWVNSR